uniref:Peptidase aspartic putative domain-containing protein n=1 Tax=Panagrolaimus davidi TaxID=227884 RepID=A0A914P062_9BILA
MSDRVQVDLRRTYNEVLETLEEYKTIFAAHSRPWSKDMRTEQGSRLQLLQQSHEFMIQALNKWEDIAKKTKDADMKKAEYDSYDEWRDNPMHRKVLKELAFTILNGKQYLMESRDCFTEDDDVASITTDSTQKEHIITTPIPKIDIPKFDGNYLEWYSFWQRFEYAIHKKPYPKVEKLISLFGLLSGRALEEVKGFTVSEENYDSIVEILINRFGNKSLIINELYVKLRDIECAKSTPESLRSTINMICNICRQLENLGVDIDNGSMKMDIIAKLPDKEGDKLKWLLITDPQNATMDDLMKKMKNIALKAELASKKKPMFETKSQNRFQPIISKSVTNFKPTVTDGKIKCNLCDEPHYTSKCPKYVTVDDKTKQLRARNFCTRCCGRNHDIKGCYSKIVCASCQGNHHTCLCKVKNGASKTSAFINIEKKQGMLLTKEVKIVNPITKETTDTVVIFDSGSQQSYVSNKIIEQLKLEKLKDEKIQVLGFGAKASSYTASLVKFEIETKNGNKSMYASSTKKIATAVPVVCAESFEQMNIKTIYKTPEILIGMDYFLEFISSFEKYDDNHYIVESKLVEINLRTVDGDDHPIFANSIPSIAKEIPMVEVDDSDTSNYYFNKYAILPSSSKHQQLLFVGQLLEL